MSDKDYSFARNFFSRPENDDTIEQFKKDYMTSMKNYQLAMQAKKRDVQTPSAPYTNKNDNYRFNGNVKKDNSSNNNNNNNNNSVSSRLSSTTTLSSDDQQDLLVLKNEVKSLLDSRDKENLDKINLQNLLNNFDSRLNNLETLILRSKDNNTNTNRYYNNKVNPLLSNVSSLYRPVSYDASPPDKNYWNKDESYDYMLRDRLRRNIYRYNSNDCIKRGGNDFKELYNCRSNPIASSPPAPTLHNMSTKYVRTPQMRYNYDCEYSNYGKFIDNDISNDKFDYQRTYLLHRNNNNNRNGNGIVCDDINTIDILNGKY